MTRLDVLIAVNYVAFLVVAVIYAADRDWLVVGWVLIAAGWMSLAQQYHREMRRRRPDTDPDFWTRGI